MLPHSHTPAPGRWALADLIRLCLVIAIGLCALTHGVAEPHHRPASAVTTSVAASAPGGAAPHGPHRHHEVEVCASDGFARTPAQTADQLPAPDVTPALVLVGAFSGPLFVRRAPQRRRRRRPGRTALVRTCRWRI